MKRKKETKRKKTNGNSQLRLNGRILHVLQNIYSLFLIDVMSKDCTYMVLRFFRSLKTPFGKSCRLFSDRSLDHEEKGKC